MWKSKLPKMNGNSQKANTGNTSAAKIYVGETKAPQTPPQSEAKTTKAVDPKQKSDGLQDWQLDSTFDAKNLTTTRKLDEFTNTLSVKALQYHS